MKLPISLKRFLCCVVFFVIGFCMIRYLHTVFLHFEKNNSNIATEFYEYIDTELDMAAFGNSAVRNGIDSAALLKDYGIYSFTLGTGNQPIAGSVFYLNELLKHQCPKVVVLDVGSIFKKSDPVSTHYIADYSPLSMNKIQFLLKMGRKLLSEGSAYDLDDVCGLFFPFLTYHSRWAELTKTDFKHDKEAIFRGFPLYFSSRSQEESEIVIADSQNDPEENEITFSHTDEIDEFFRICSENHIQVVLIKTPRRDWNMDSSKYISDLAEEYAVPYLDFNIPGLYAECGFDSQQDFYDYRHLNYYGAEKLTDYLGKFLVSEYDIGRRSLTDEDQLFVDQYDQAVLTGHMIYAKTDDELIDFLTQNGFEVLLQMNAPTEDLWSSRYGQWILDITGCSAEDVINDYFSVKIKDGAMETESLTSSKKGFAGVLADNTKYIIHNNRKNRIPVFAVGDEMFSFRRKGLNMLIYDSLNGNVAAMFTVTFNGEDVVRTLDYKFIAF